MKEEESPNGTKLGSSVGLLSPGVAQQSLMDCFGQSLKHLREGHPPLGHFLSARTEKEDLMAGGKLLSGYLEGNPRGAF